MTATTGNIVTLANGQQVDSTSPEWRKECLVRWQFRIRMRKMDAHQRRELIAAVRRDKGDIAAQRLADAYTADWQARKAAAAKP